MAWTSPRTWVAAETVTAALMNTHVRDNLNAVNGYVRKTADESVTSSIALQNDDHLVYTIGATGTYLVDMTLFGVSAANAAGDLLVGFSFPTGTLHFGVQALDTALASGSVAGTMAATGALSATSATTSIGVGLSTSTVVVKVYAEFIATATGTLQFMWAQNSSSVSASTLKSGSYMTVRQVA